MVDQRIILKTLRLPLYLVRVLVLGVLSLFPAKIALRFLMRLDNWLYFLQGQTAIRYGGGLHPKHRLTRYHDFFVERIETGDRVLDIGCGVGAVAYDVAERTGAIVTGIDINPENIAQAKEHHAHANVRYLVGDALKMLPEEPYDVIILSNVLEHLSERSSFLQAVCQHIQPKQILIRVPNFERDWRVPLKQELGIEWRLDPTHEIEYTIEGFCEELSSANLQLTELNFRWGEIWAVARHKNVMDGK